MVWYKDEGFSRNPLFMDPMDRDDTLQNYSSLKDNLIYHVLAGGICLIAGGRSTGKTMLLKHVVNEARGRRKLIYINLRKISKRFSLDHVIDKRRSLLDKLLNRKVNDVILLLDNAEDLTTKNFEKLHYYYDKKIFHSIVLTAVDHEKLRMPKSLKDRIGHRIFSTQELERLEAVDMAKEKLDNKELLKEYQLEILYIMANKDIGKFMYYIDIILAYTSDNPDETLSSKRMASLIENVKMTEKDKETEHDLCECGSAVFEINGVFRCPSCDTFCYGCGALVSEDDTKCPSCGKKFEGVV